MDDNSPHSERRLSSFHKRERPGCGSVQEAQWSSCKSRFSFDQQMAASIVTFHSAGRAAGRQGDRSIRYVLHATDPCSRPLMPWTLGDGYGAGAAAVAAAAAVSRRSACCQLLCCLSGVQRCLAARV
jgi:hypothetical protein